MLTLAAFSSRFTPLMFAALLCWILCVTVHEFAHALVGYWGGDDTVKHRGLLTLDPTRFIDPINTLLIPAVVLLLGGFPLPGASVMIDRSRLKSEKWGSYVSAAGPASNFIIFLLMCIPLHPKVGLVNPFADVQPTWVHFLGAMATLNMYGVLFNLIPVPPLDGFGIIEHKLDHETRWKLRQPQVGFGCLMVLMLILWNVPQAMIPFLYMLAWVTDILGIPLHLLMDGYYFVIFDMAPRA
ncbi:MAG: site-2 protease family protein [Planctomycetota bacterium]